MEKKPIDQDPLSDQKHKNQVDNRGKEALAEAFRKWREEEGIGEEGILQTVSDKETKVAESQAKANVKHSTPPGNSEVGLFDKLQNDRLQEEIKDIVDYRDLRKKYGERVFWFMCAWCVIVFVVLISAGSPDSGFELPSSVLVTLVGGTTVSVIGLVGFIIKGLFNPNGKRG